MTAGRNHLALAMLGALAVALAVAPAAVGQNVPRFFGGGVTAYDPEVSTVQSGALLDAQVVVSDDRKYVTINTQAQDSNLLALHNFEVASGPATVGGGFVGAINPGAGDGTTITPGGGNGGDGAGNIGGSGAGAGGAAGGVSGGASGGAAAGANGARPAGAGAGNTGRISTFAPPDAPGAAGAAARAAARGSSETAVADLSDSPEEIYRRGIAARSILSRRGMFLLARAGS